MSLERDRLLALLERGLITDREYRIRVRRISDDRAGIRFHR